MTEGSSSGRERSGPRRLAAVFGPYHNLSYYCPEIRDFTTAGMRGWWMAYFAYRAAPLGRASTELVTATFYGFAPRMVARAIPAAWDVLAPEAALALRLDAVDRALRRVLGDGVASPEVAEAARLAREAVEGCDVAGRPLFAAHASLAWPDLPHLVLFQACTLLREHRGDSHNVALAASGLDGVASHVMMAALGHGNRASILPIRGWTEAEWEVARERLEARGWVDGDGAVTAAGRAARGAVEDLTDRLADEPCRRLGDERLDRLVELMGPIDEVLAGRGGVPTSWPPPHLRRS